MFPYSIELAGDGLGNFWILDIDSHGNWNSIYYVCHDPAVIVKSSENLGEFIMQIDEFGTQGHESTLTIIQEATVTEIWKRGAEGMTNNGRDYDLGNWQIEFPEVFLIADLTGESIKTGFPWSISGPRTKIIRPTDKPLWIVEKRKKRNFLLKLFGKEK